jgi:hypothetical protein
MLFTLLLLVSALTGNPFPLVQRQFEKTPEDAKTGDLIERIERGDDPNALLEAGRSGNLA